jgi:hypothetical protein
VGCSSLPHPIDPGIKRVRPPSLKTLGSSCEEASHSS